MVYARAWFLLLAIEFERWSVETNRPDPLRLAIHELLHRTDIPPIVSINEAIDLSKTFSNPDSKRFING